MHTTSPASAHTDQKPITVSIVIPHMGREQMLLDTLQSICELDTTGFDLSVVVVSKNDTFSEQLLAFKHRLSIYFEQVSMVVTISDQRNIGARKFNTDLVGFIDADVALSENWLCCLYSLLQNSKAVLTSATQIAAKNAGQVETIRSALSSVSKNTEVDFLPGANLLLTRAHFEQSGGFPSDLVTCEDYVFTQRVAQLGPLYHTGDAQFVHLGEDKTYWGMAKKEVWRGQSNLRSLKGRSIPLSEYPSLLLPSAFTLGVLMSLILFILEWPGLAVLSVCGSLFILLVYALRLYKQSKISVSLVPILGFYSLYFPARALGTIIGALNSVGSKSHH